MGAYRVVKEKEAVTLSLKDGTIMEGFAFLSPFASMHKGKETLLELLCDNDRFFPLEDSAGKLSLIRKETILYAQQDLKEEVDTYIEKKAVVTISLSGNRKLEGTIVLDLPETNNRLLDYVNTYPDFLTLTSNSTLFIINSREIVRIEEI